MPRVPAGYDPLSSKAEVVVEAATADLANAVNEKVATETKELPPVSPEEAEAIANLTEAEIMQILSRGVVTTQLGEHQDDPTRRYVWALDHDVKISGFKALGYRLEVNKEGKTVHPTGDTRIRLGDVVLMSIDRSRWEVIQRVKAERQRRRREQGKTFYKKKAEAEVAKGGPLPIMNEQ